MPEDTHVDQGQCHSVTVSALEVDDLMHARVNVRPARCIARKAINHTYLSSSLRFCTGGVTWYNHTQNLHVFEIRVIVFVVCDSNVSL